MINNKLTDKPEITELSADAIIHVVEPNNFTQGADGSSFKYKTSNLPNAAQNNKARQVYLGYFLADDPDAGSDFEYRAAQRLNTMYTSLIIAADETPIIMWALYANQNSGEVTALDSKLSFIFRPGKGTYGSTGTEVSASDFYLLSRQAITEGDILLNPGATITPLGEIADGDFLPVANAGTYDFTNSGEVTDSGVITYYFSYTVPGIGDEPDKVYFVAFVGTPGVYGVGFTPFASTDFATTTNSGIIPGAPVPNLDAVLAAGGNSFDKPAAFIHNEAGVFERQTVIDYLGISHESQGGGITRMVFEERTGADEIQLTIPAKASDDTIATIGDISEGLESQNLEAVTNNGNTTPNDIVLEGGTEELTLTSTGSSYDKGGFNTSIDYINPVANAKYSWPAKTANDTIAMISDIESGLSEQDLPTVIQNGNVVTMEDGEMFIFNYTGPGAVTRLYNSDFFQFFEMTGIGSSKLWLSNNAFQIESTVNDHNINIQSGAVSFRKDGHSVNLRAPLTTLTVNRSVYFQDADGTIALISDIEAGLEGAVPYVGATGSVNLGENYITALGGTFGTDGINTTGNVTAAGFRGAAVVINTDGLIEAVIYSSLLTASRTFNLPDKDGTLTVLSDIVSSSATGTVVDFLSPKTFNTHDSPGTGNITHALSNARLGLVQKIYHNSGSEPTVPAEWVLLGSTAYIPGMLNIIYAEYVDAERVEYWITQEN